MWITCGVDSPLDPASTERGGEIVERHEHCGNQKPDPDAQENDECWLDEGHEVLKEVIHLAAVEVGGAFEDEIKAPRLLPDPDHLGDEPRDLAEFLKGRADGVPGFHRLPRLEDDIPVDA